jgi:hypothetical protein
LNKKQDYTGSRSLSLSKAEVGGGMHRFGFDKLSRRYTSGNKS